VQIEVETVEARLSGVDDATPEGARIIDFATTYLAFDDPSAWHQPWKRRAMQAGTSDGRIHLFQPRTGRFPAGYAEALHRAVLADLGVDLPIVDRRVQPCEPLPIDRVAGWMTRDPKYGWQLDAVRRCVEKGRGILWIPTGGGKTEIAIALSELLPTRWLFLVKSKDLLRQAADRRERIVGRPAGVVGDGRWDDGPDFVVATFQTLHRALKSSRPEESRRARRLLNQAGGLFIDEAHVLPAAAHLYVANRCPAYWRFGLSGTPLARGDRRSVCAVGCLGPIIYRIGAPELIRRGVIAAPEIRMLRCEQASDKPTWQGVYGDLIVRSSARNRLLAEAATLCAKPALLFVKQERHGLDLTKRLGRVGLRVEFAWGKLGSDARRTIARRLERGDLDVAVCSVIWQEGLDVPGLRSLVIGSGGKSAIAAIQRVGRGTRVVPGKSSFVVWDVDDRGNKWTERHSRERRRAYAREGYEVADVDLSQRRLDEVGT